MNRRVLVIGLFVAAALILVAGGVGTFGQSDDESGEWRLSVGKAFQTGVDLEEFRLVAVQEGGRVKTFDTLAREKVKYFKSSRDGRDIDPVLLYLDMMLVPQNYAGQDFIHIKKKLMRVQIVRGVRSLVAVDGRRGPISEQELARIEQDGQVSFAFLDHPAVREVLSRLERDLVSTNKEVQKVYAARNVADPRAIRGMWRVVPPNGGTDVDPWMSIDEVISQGVPRDAAHSGIAATPALDANVIDGLEMAGAWTELERAWRFQDTDVVNTQLEQLRTLFAAAEPSLYPDVGKREIEHWYYRANKLTPAWLLFFFALPFLGMGFVYRLGWARVCGLVLFSVGFVMLTASIALRWYLAGRIPNANMFEAILASAWFGALIALILEYILRRRSLKNVSALAASIWSMLALMIGHFQPDVFGSQIHNDITTVAPLLDRTIWLYIHTNMIIASYALVFFAAVSSMIYLAFWLLYASPLASRVQKLWMGADKDPDAFGGAAAIILGQGDSTNTGVARSLDGATMIFMELAFLSLFVGTILGAVWADVSWGRPWGWDPKEVFALNTWLVFLILVHVRLKVKDKGFWTAVIAVIGMFVMLFNWFVVNFLIVGLHSYA